MIPPKPNQKYQPRVYGFKIHHSSLYYRNHEEVQSNRRIESRERSRKNKNRQGGGR